MTTHARLLGILMLLLALDGCRSVRIIGDPNGGDLPVDNPVVPLPDAPSELAAPSQLVYEPRTGTMLQMSAEGDLFELDLERQTWTAVATPAPDALRLGTSPMPRFAVPVETYKVTLWVVWSPPSGVFVYKHRATTE